MGSKLPYRWLLGGGFSGVMWLTGHFTIRGLVTLFSGVMALFLYVLWAYQESLLYQPKVFPQYTRPQDNPPGYRNPGEHGIPYEDVWLDTEDGVRLHAWWVRPDKVEERRARATLLFFHANAGNMGFRLDNVRQMYADFHLNVFILSYRGYGNSEGTPTEKGILIDAECTWQHVTHRADVDASRIIVFGRSLGGSVAIALASRHSQPAKAVAGAGNSAAAARSTVSGAPDGGPPYIAGLIVENTFTSISSLVNTLFPLLSPLKPLILRLDWPAIRRIALVTAPILLLSGQLDEVVPAQHMQDLYDAAVNARAKSILKVARGLHNNTWSEGGEEYRKAFKHFLEDYCGIDQSQPHTEDVPAVPPTDQRTEDSGLTQRRLPNAASALPSHSTL